MSNQPLPEDEDWDFEAARKRLSAAPKVDGRAAARKSRKKKMVDSVDGRSLRSTGRIEHLNFKASPRIKAALAAYVPKGGISLWLERAIIRQLKEEGHEIDDA
jgi:hypothetical protein